MLDRRNKPIRNLLNVQNTCKNIGLKDQIDIVFNRSQICFMQKKSEKRNL